MLSTTRSLPESLATNPRRSIQGFFNKGGHFEHRFETEGTYAYFCRRHPNMKGEIRVTE
jgi:plastocyanin